MTKPTPVVQATKQLLAGIGKSARLQVAHILPDPNQPRKIFDSDKYEETKASIRAIGLQVPITVNPGPVRDGIQYYYIKYGENRWRIHVDLEWSEIDCVIDPKVYMGELDVMRVLTQAAENINRIDHGHSEIAAVYALYFDEEKKEHPEKGVGKIQDDFATIFGKSLVWVQNYAAMANLRPEFLARVDIKGKTQIPFMAAVALGRNPKERQPRILHEAETLAGSRRDMLYTYVVRGTHQAKRANGERVRHNVAANKRSFMKMPSNLQKTLDHFGVGMGPLDRETYIRETMACMSPEELTAMTRGLNDILESIEALRGKVKNRLENHQGNIPGPIPFKQSGEKPEEEVPQAPSPSTENTTGRAPWPDFTRPREEAGQPKPSGKGWEVRRFQGKRY